MTNLAALSTEEIIAHLKTTEEAYEADAAAFFAGDQTKGNIPNPNLTNEKFRNELLGRSANDKLARAYMKAQLKSRRA